MGPPLIAALDFESAGEAPGKTDTPIQVGIAAMCGTEIDPSSLYMSYIQPGRPVTWAARKIHGISDAALSQAPTMASLWPDFRRRLSGRIIAAHNASTERRFLHIFPLHGLGPWVDTLQLARKVWPGLPDYSLGALCHQLTLTPALTHLLPQGRFHDALYDATASLLLVKHFLIQTAQAQLPQDFLLP